VAQGEGPEFKPQYHKRKGGRDYKNFLMRLIVITVLT
jgi:hypothetical protein